MQCHKTIICVVCELPHTSRYSHTRYCSNACQQRAYRWRRNAKTFTLEQIADALARYADGATADQILDHLDALVAH